MTTVTATSLTQDMQATTASSNKLSQDFDDFLNLLTTQLQNQDPLSPMDSTEFTNQLVGFSQVEQQINMNEKLEQILSLELSSMSTVAANYVGMNVSFLGEVTYFGGDPLNIEYVLDDNAASSKIRILDEEGNIVRTVEADKSAGHHEFTWDGTDDYGQPVAEGNYTIRVDALDGEGAAITYQTAVPALVSGVAAEDGVIQLLLRGDSIIPVGSVIKAERPDLS